MEVIFSKLLQIYKLIAIPRDLFDGENTFTHRYAIKWRLNPQNLRKVYLRKLQST